MRTLAGVTLPFLLVVGFCVAQVAWWTYYQVREAGELQQIDAEHLHAQCFVGAVALERRHATTPFASREQADSWLASRTPPLVLAPDADGAGIPLAQVAPAAHAALGALMVVPAASHRDEVADRRDRRVRMFLMEGVFFLFVVMVGFVLFMRSLRREVRLNAAQERFLSGTTHDLKTPITALRLGLETIASGRLEPARQARYVGNLLGQVSALEARVETILAAAAYGRRHEFVFETRDLAADLVPVLDDFAPRFAEAGIAFERTVTLTQPVLVPGNARLLQLMLRNLLDNALKYSDPGGRVHVTLAAEGDTAVLTVGDAGIGIPRDEIGRVFDRFYRARSAATQLRGGGGLGLFLVREITRSHGGSVTAHSDGEGRGSTFVVRLPVTRGGRAT